MFVPLEKHTYKYFLNVVKASYHLQSLGNKSPQQQEILKMMLSMSNIYFSITIEVFSTQ